MVRQLYLYSIEAADFPDSVTSENTLREFPLVIATVAKVSRKRGLRLVVCVKVIQLLHIVQGLFLRNIVDHDLKVSIHHPGHEDMFQTFIDHRDLVS